MIYCNQVWGNNYPTIINKLVLIQKKLVRIITCSPYIAHTEPLMYANKILSPTDINAYLTGTFMYQCMHKDAPELFLNFFSTTSDYHDHDTRHSEDLHVPYGRLDVRKFSIITHGANVWNFPAKSNKKCSVCTRIQATISQLSDWKISLYYNHFKPENFFYFIMTVPIDESCNVLFSCWSHVSISPDPTGTVEAHWVYK